MVSVWFKLVSTGGNEPLHRSLSEQLYELVKTRLPTLTNLGFITRVDEEDLMLRNGLVGGVPVPEVIVVTADVAEQLAREKVRDHLQGALAEMGRPDIVSHSEEASLLRLAVR